MDPEGEESPAYHLYEKLGFRVNIEETRKFCKETAQLLTLNRKDYLEAKDHPMPPTSEDAGSKRTLSKLPLHFDALEEGKGAPLKEPPF